MNDSTYFSFLTRLAREAGEWFSALFLESESPVFFPITICIGLLIIGFAVYCFRRYVL